MPVMAPYPSINRLLLEDVLHARRMTLGRDISKYFGECRLR